MFFYLVVVQVGTTILAVEFILKPCIHVIPVNWIADVIGGITKYF